MSCPSLSPQSYSMMMMMMMMTASERGEGGEGDRRWLAAIEKGLQMQA